MEYVQDSLVLFLVVVSSISSFLTLYFGFRLLKDFVRLFQPPVPSHPKETCKSVNEAMSKRKPVVIDDFRALQLEKELDRTRSRQL